MTAPIRRVHVKLNAVMFTMMLEELMAGPCRAQDLADYTGMSMLTVQRTIRVMHRRKVIHIKAWEKDVRGAWTCKVYQLGEGKDAPKPKPKLSTEYESRRLAKDRQARMYSALAGGVA